MLAAGSYPSCPPLMTSLQPMPSQRLSGATSGAFTSRSSRHGREYYDEGRVTIEGADEDTVVAFVKDDRPRPYGVAIRFAEVPARSRLQVSCTCAFFLEGYPCKHIYATLLAIDAAGIEMIDPAFFDGRVDVVPYKPDLPLDQDWFFEGEHSLRRITGSGPGASPVRTPEWQDKVKALRRAVGNWQEKLPEEVVLERGVPREVLYYVDAGRSEDLQIPIIAVEERLTGEMVSVPTTLRTQDLSLVERAEDRLALERLFDTPLEGPSASGKDRLFMVPPSAWTRTRDILMATGNLFCRTSDGTVSPALELDEGEPWRFSLTFEPDIDEPEEELADDEAEDEAAEGEAAEGETPEGEAEDDAAEAAAQPAVPEAPAATIEVEQEQPDPDAPVELRVHGTLRRGLEVKSHGEPDAILKHGWAVLDGHIINIGPSDGLSWLRYLRKAGGMGAPITQLADLLRELVSIPGLPPLRLPEPWTTEKPVPETEVVFAEPKPRVRTVEAQILFHYPGGQFGAGNRDSGLVDDDRNVVVLRDTEAERRSLTYLADLGCRRAEGRADLGITVPQENLPHLVRRLVQDGLRVEASGRRLRGMTEQDLRIESNQDWFDLTGDVTFDGVKAELPELLKAIKAGSQFVQLDDGTEGVLPEEWLERYSALANLGTKRGRNLRFAPSQAILLDMLLEGQNEVAFDDGFEQARAALDRDARVEMLQEPEQFQGTLRDYQRTGLGWMAFLRQIGLGGCLADDMGLGKTVQVLAMLEQRRLEGATGPNLVVAPRSLVHNWMDEAGKFTPHLKATAFVGSERHEHLPKLLEYDIVVTTYGTLRRDVDALSEIEFDYVILDEAQAIKNASAQATKAARMLKGKHRLALSGTPIENHLIELWSIFEFLNRGMLGSRREFGSLARPDNRGALQRVAKGLSPMILRRTKDQVLSELPQKTELTVYVELEGEEARRYNELRDHLRRSLTEKVATDGMARSRVHVLEALLRLRQAACHPGLIDEKRKNQGSAKLDTLIDHLSEVLEEGHKVLVFSQFVKLLTVVRARLEKEDIKYAYLDGSTRDRQKVVKDFQADDECGVFLISLRAGGLGLNLTEADYVYILDPWWNPAVEAQAIDRAHRIGQTRPVFAYRLIARGTVEEKIQALKAEKVELAEAIVASNESLMGKMSLDDLRSLLS